MTSKRRPKGSGTIRTLPSGNKQAILRDAPDGGTYRRTFDTKVAADRWLAAQNRAIAAGTWSPPDAPKPEAKAPLFKDYAGQWLERRPLKPRTRADYRRHLDAHLIPTFGSKRLDAITVADVRAWHATLLPTSATQRAHVYGLLRTILNTAHQDDLIAAVPTRIRGAGQSPKRSMIVSELPTPDQVAELADAMPDERFRLMVLVAAWCGLRFGELTELRRSDVSADGSVIRVRRAVSRTGPSTFVVGDPKSFAGTRNVAVPPHIRDELKAYAATVDGLLFTVSPGRHMSPKSLYERWYKARDAVGLPDLRWHDLRHFSGTLAAQTGATLREVQGRLGHSTVSAAMRYQRAAEDRDVELAERLSRLA